MRLLSVILLGLFFMSVTILSATPVFSLNVDTFTRTVVGDQWDFNNGGSGSNSLVISTNELLITDGSNSHNTYTNTTFTEPSNFMLIRFASKISTTGWAIDVTLNGSSVVANDFRWLSGTYYYVAPGPVQKATNGTYSAGDWDLHEIYVNKSSYTMDWYVDGVLICNDCAYQNNVDIKTLLVTTQNGASGNVRFDNFSISNNLTGVSLDVYDFTQVSLNDFSVQLYDENLTLLTNQTESGVGTTLNITDNGNYTLQFTKIGYKQLNTTLEYLGTHKFLNFVSDIAPSINISFFDEITRSPLINSSYKLIFGTTFGETVNNSASSVFIDLNNTGELEIEYNRVGYELRHYFVNITPQTNSSINLYLLNNTDDDHVRITYTITDQDGTPLNNVIVKALRRYILSGVPTFEVVDMSKSDINGEGALWLEKYDATYKFFVEQGGVIILQTSENNINSVTNTISLRADLSDSVITSSVNTAQLNVTFAWNESTLLFTTNWNDPTGITSQLCVDIKQIGQSIVSVNSSCGSGSTGSLVLGVPNSTGEYVVYAYQVTTTTYSDKPAGTFSFQLSQIKETIGVSGLFYLLMFTVMGALVGMSVFQNTTGTIALTSVGFIIGVLFKITELGWVSAMSVVLVAGFLIYAIRKFGGTGS